MKATLPKPQAISSRSSDHCRSAPTSSSGSISLNLALDAASSFSILLVFEDSEMISSLSELFP